MIYFSIGDNWDVYIAIYRINNLSSLLNIESNSKLCGGQCRHLDASLLGNTGNS